MWTRVPFAPLAVAAVAAIGVYVQRSQRRGPRHIALQPARQRTVECGAEEGCIHFPMVERRGPANSVGDHAAAPCIKTCSVNLNDECEAKWSGWKQSEGLTSVVEELAIFRGRFQEASQSTRGCFRRSATPLNQFPHSLTIGLPLRARPTLPLLRMHLSPTTNARILQSFTL